MNYVAALLAFGSVMGFYMGACFYVLSAFVSTMASGTSTGWTFSAAPGKRELLYSGNSIGYLLALAIGIGIVIAVFSYTRNEGPAIKLVARSGAAGFGLAYLVAWLLFTLNGL
jgi:hypothetical protein